MQARVQEVKGGQGSDEKIRIPLEISQHEENVRRGDALWK